MTETTDTAPWVLPIALDETTRPVLRPLPTAAVRVLHAVAAPPRLVAHLRAVHDVAARLVGWTTEQGLTIDADAVLFGAATHDIGKHCTRLSCPDRAPNTNPRAVICCWPTESHPSWRSTRRTTRRGLPTAGWTSCW